MGVFDMIRQRVGAEAREAAPRVQRLVEAAAHERERADRAIDEAVRTGIARPTWEEVGGFPQTEEGEEGHGGPREYGH